MASDSRGRLRFLSWFEGESTENGFDMAGVPVTTADEGAKEEEKSDMAGRLGQVIAVIIVCAGCPK